MLTQTIITLALSLLITPTQSEAQTPCAEAATQAKFACARFAIAFRNKVETAMAQQNCNEIQNLKSNAEGLFKRGCDPGVDRATQVCASTNSGGITGNQGVVGTTNALDDLTLTIQAIYEKEFKPEANSLRCNSDGPPSS